MLTDNIIRLRAPEPDDIDSMYRWENDTDSWSEGAVRAPMSRHLLHDFVINYNPDPYATSQMRLIIELVENSRPVGCIDLYEFDGFNRRSGLGIVIDPACRKRGYGLRALELMCGYVRQELGLHQLWAVVSRTNEASNRLFRSAGFTPSGNLRSWVRKGESYVDALIYQRLLV